MITRTIYVAKGKIVEIIIDEGNVKKETLSDYFKISTTPIDVEEEKIKLAKLNQGKIITITDCTVTKEIRAISLDDFYSKSEAIERPKSQLKKESK